MTTIQKVQAKVSSWSRVGVRRIGKQPSGVNSCSVAVQDRIADGVGSEPAGSNGRRPASREYSAHRRFLGEPVWKRAERLMMAR